MKLIKKAFLLLMILFVTVACVFHDVEILYASDDEINTTPTQESQTIGNAEDKKSNIPEEQKQSQEKEEAGNRVENAETNEVHENTQVQTLINEISKEEVPLKQIVMNSGETDTRYFTFNGTTLTGFVTYIEGVSESAPRDLVIPTSYIKEGVSYNVEHIGKEAFAGQGANIDSITLNNNLLTIEDGAFKNLSIPSLTIPSSVTSIGNNAFDNCTSLAMINLPEGLTTIGDSAFSSTAVTSITMPSTITSIGNSAFKDCKSLASVTLNEGLTSVGDATFQGTAVTSITMPSTINNIGGSAFNDCKSLTSVTLNEGLTSVGDATFQGTAVTSITMPSTITNIGGSAFEDCKSLTSVTLNEGLTSVGDATFQGTAVTSITMPSTITNIGNSAFKDCTSLATVTLPEGLASIENAAFRHTAITNITIPATVTKIGDSAFDSCTSLTMIDLPQGLTYIGSYAFGSTAITSIAIPKGVTRIEHSTFYNCTSLVTVNLPEGLTTIDDFAFWGTAIRNITIPDTTIQIGRDAFNTTMLTKIILNKNFNEITGKPWGASNAKISWKDSDSYKGHFYYKDGVIFGIKDEPESGCIDPAMHDGGTLTIPSEIDGQKITKIDDFAFQNTKYKQLILPDTITEIGDSAFRSTAITSITIPSAVISIGDSAFENCTNLTMVTLNEGLTTIGNKAFSSIAITDIVMPSTVISIGYSTFYKCTKLKKVILNEGLTTISDSAFSYTAITNIAMPSTVTRIGHSTFYFCTRLTSVTLNEGLTFIGDSAFSYTAITDIAMPSTVTSIGHSAFGNCTSLVTVNLPEGLTFLGTRAFSSAAITSITIPSTLTNIDNSTFNECKKLTKVILNEGLTTISDSAFSSTAITSITIPSTVISVGDSAFKDCTSLTMVTLHEGLQTIGLGAFENSSISSITRIPDSVTSIGTNSFTGANIKQLTINKNRNECPYKANEPWGATGANVYYKGEFIEMEHTTDGEGHKRNINYTFNSGASSGLITEITYPDGKSSNVSANTYSGKYEVNKNGIYTFKSVSGTNNTFTYDVEINDIGLIDLTGNNFSISNSDLSRVTFDELLAYGNIKAVDLDTKKDLPITSDKTLNQIKAALRNDGDQITIKVKAENDIGTIEEKDITITMNNSKHVVQFYDNDDYLKQVFINDGDTLTEWTPTKKGASFTNWYTDKTLNTSYDFSTTVKNSFSLYAGWKLDHYDIAYDTGFNDLKIPTKTNVTINDDNLLPSGVSKLGYIFKNWTFGTTEVTSTTKLDEIVTTEISGDTLTIKANWDQNKYTIKYDTKFTDIVVANKDNVGIDDDDLLPVELSKKGYTFEGWYVGNQQITSTLQLGDIISSEPLNGIVEMEAKWTENKYNIAYDTGFDDLKILTKTNVTINDNNLLPSGVSKLGYTFKNWTFGTTEVTSTTKLDEIVTTEISGDTLTIKANWEKESYRIYFVIVGTAQGNIPNAQTVRFEEKVEEPNMGAYANYTFDGWYTDQECNQSYDFDSTVSKELTLYGKWTYVAPSQEVEDNKPNVDLPKDEGEKETSNTDTSKKSPNTGLEVAGQGFMGIMLLAMITFMQVSYKKKKTKKS